MCTAVAADNMVFHDRRVGELRLDPPVAPQAGFCALRCGEVARQAGGTEAELRLEDAGWDREQPLTRPVTAGESAVAGKPQEAEKPYLLNGLALTILAPSSMV